MIVVLGCLLPAKDIMPIIVYPDFCRTTRILFVRDTDYYSLLLLVDTDAVKIIRLGAI